MSIQTLYYGEIAARISCQLVSICSTNLRLQNDAEESIEDTICSISANAARVFDSLEDLSGEHYIDWNKALDSFALTIREHLLQGEVPTMADMILMAAKSLNNCGTAPVANFQRVL